MKITDLPRTVLRVQYQLARIPLALIEQQLSARLSDDARSRLLYERSLGALDATAGRLLGDPELKKRGTVLAERSETLGRAAALDAEATRKQQQADAKLAAARERVVTDRNEAREATDQQVEDAIETAEKRKRDAAQAASEQAAAVKKKADEQAAQRIQAAESAKRDKLANIRETEEAAAEVVDAKRDEAQSKHLDAAQRRTEADHVENLANAEQKKRQAARKKAAPAND